MSRNDDLEKWEEEEPFLSEMRGVLSFDYNNHLVLVCAEVGAVAQVFAQMRGVALLKNDVAEGKLNWPRNASSFFVSKAIPGRKFWIRN